jgi:NADH-quinone oxidoreductase subunit H
MLDLIEHLVKIALVLGVMLGTTAYLIYFERKIAAWIQDRIGPNRVGPLGLLQPIADGLKFLFKEDVTPPGVDRPLFRLAPVVIMIPALCTIAVVPWGDAIELFGRTIKLQIADVNIGVLYVLSVSSLGVYGIVLGGWASNSKYAFLGGLRSAAQLLSYEIPLALSLLGVVMLAGSLQLDDITREQTGTWFGFLPRWNVFIQPAAFLVFMICSFAENNRLPFDVAEAEQELVAGYHVEYSSMKFAMFFLAEYCNMIVASCLMVVLFFGGWHFPYIAEAGGANLLGTGLLSGLVKVGVFCGKVAAFLFFYMWVRWTLPRFRFDQLMGLAWKVLVPIALGNLVVVGLAIYWAKGDVGAGKGFPAMLQWLLLTANAAGFFLVLYVLPRAAAVLRGQPTVAAATVGSAR